MRFELNIRSDRVRIYANESRMIDIDNNGLDLLITQAPQSGVDYDEIGEYGYKYKIIGVDLY